MQLSTDKHRPVQLSLPLSTASASLCEWQGLPTKGFVAWKKLYTQVPILSCHVADDSHVADDRWQLDASTQQAQLLEEQLVQQLTHGWTDKEACKSYLDGILKSCKDNKLHLSTQVLASTAAYLAQQQWWGSLDDLLRAQALPSLAMCPGLTLAVVQGGHFSLLATILPKVTFLLLLQSAFAASSPEAIFMVGVSSCSNLAHSDRHTSCVHCKQSGFL